MAVNMGSSVFRDFRPFGMAQKCLKRHIENEPVASIFRVEDRWQHILRNNGSDLGYTQKIVMFNSLRKCGTKTASAGRGGGGNDSTKKWSVNSSLWAYMNCVIKQLRSHEELAVYTSELTINPATDQQHEKHGANAICI
jgi:hypothetical protein